MTAERWREVEAHFATAVDLAPAGQATYLMAVRRRDAGLAAEIATLLAADRRCAGDDVISAAIAGALETRFGPKDNRARAAFERAARFHETQGDNDRAAQFRDKMR